MAKNQIGLVVFDLDGTLYSQVKLRPFMIIELLSVLPWTAAGRKKMQAIRMFRRVHEELAESGASQIEEKHYKQTAIRAAIDESLLRQTISTWMLKRPLKYLRLCRTVGAQQTFKWLRQHGIKIAILSDYPASEKLEAMNLNADLVVSANDSKIDRLKPHPKGLEVILDTYNIQPENCLVVGDRHDRDKICAEMMGCQFLLAPGDLRKVIEYVESSGC